MEEAGEIQRFEYSGRISPRAGLVGLFGLAFAALFGLLYQQLLDVSPLILLSPFLTLLLGFLLGGLSLGTLRAAHVRNLALARVLVWLLPLAALLMAHLESLGFGREGFAGIGAALEERLRQGDPLPDGSFGLAGSALVMFWIAEVICVLAIAVPLPLIWWHRAVFDETTPGFLVRKRVAVRYGPSARSLRRAVDEGGMEALLSLGMRKLPENSEEGEFRFYLHEPAEDADAWLTVQWFGKLEGPRGRKIQRDVMVLRRIRVDREYLQALLGD